MIDFDDIDEEPPKRISYPDSVYNGRGENECIHIFRKNPLERLGTGFLIDHDGVFVTAAHTFKSKYLENITLNESEVSDFFAVYKSLPYSINNMLCEYTGKDSYNDEDMICKDLFIGKLKDFYPPEDFNPGTLSNEDICINELLLEGYNPSIDYDNYVRIEFQAISSFYHQLSVSVELPIEEKKHDRRFNMNNSESFYLEQPQKYAGLSGGPVYKDKIIYGMFLGNVYIKSQYILLKLEELGISLYQ